MNPLNFNEQVLQSELTVMADKRTECFAAQTRD